MPPKQLVLKYNEKTNNEDTIKILMMYSVIKPISSDRMSATWKQKAATVQQDQNWTVYIKRCEVLQIISIYPM